MRKWIFVAVFASGLTSLAVEMAASRLLGNYFGASNLSWAAIIGLILVYLTIGYFVGGKWADRSPHPETFFKILAWSGFTVGLVPLVSQPVLQRAAEAFDHLALGVLFGSFTAVMILFVVPVILMGTASPFAIRLLINDTAGAGTLAGRISAVSTLGSFLGTFIPSLILIPLVGTFQTFVALGLFLTVVSLACYWAVSGISKAIKLIWMPIMLVLIAIVGNSSSSKLTAGLLYETESAYNYIQVLQDGDYRYLRLNEGQGVHSVYTDEPQFYNGPWEQVLIAPYFNEQFTAVDEVESIAILGLAGGTTARQAFSVFPNVKVTGIEIDPKIIQAGYDFFDMKNPNLTVVTQDARWALSQQTGRYQVISIDAYRPPYIPWHMTTVEFFTLVREKLTQEGVMVINVGRAPHDRSLVDALSSTIARVFPSVHVVDLPDSLNSMVFATVQPTVAENLVRNYGQIMDSQDFPSLLRVTMASAVVNLHSDPIPNDIVFTDDKAPIEWYTNRLVLKYFASEGMTP